MECVYIYSIINPPFLSFPSWASDADRHGEGRQPAGLRQGAVGFPEKVGAPV